MTITTTSSRMPPYAGNGVATAFPVTIPFPRADCIRAVLARPGLPDADLVPDTDFTLTGAGDPSGGTLTFPKAGSAYGVLDEGEFLHILRVVPLTQERAWDNVDALDATQIEAGDDRLTLIAQQLQEQLDRALQWPATATDPDTDPAAFVAAAAAAQAGAEAARAAAELAQTNAEAARDDAQAAQGLAEDAQAAAEAAAASLGIPLPISSVDGLSDALDGKLSATATAASARYA